MDDLASYLISTLPMAAVIISYLWMARRTRISSSKWMEAQIDELRQIRMTLERLAAVAEKREG